MFAQRRLKSAWAFAKSDQSLRCPHEETGSLAIQNASTEDFDQTPQMRRLIWIIAGRTCPKVGFLTLRLNSCLIKQMSQRTTKPTISSLWPAKTQISLYIYPVCQWFTFIPFWIARRLKTAHANSEDSDQPARMRRLIWVFAGRTPL